MPRGSCGRGRAHREVEGAALCPGPALSAHIVPPISSASRLLMARPRPVPPYLRVVELSAWLKLWNRRLIALLAQADAGVAHREVQQLAGLASFGRDGQHHFAASR